MNTLLAPFRIRSSAFHYDGNSKMLSAEMSALEHIGFRWGQVYDDACDVGLIVVSANTGREVVFVVESEVTHETDIVYWRLKPAHKYLWVDNDIRVVIYND